MAGQIDGSEVAAVTLSYFVSFQATNNRDKAQQQFSTSYTHEHMLQALHRQGTERVLYKSMNIQSATQLLLPYCRLAEVCLVFPPTGPPCSASRKQHCAGIVTQPIEVHYQNVEL